MIEQNGEVIKKAYEILENTYKEISNLESDFKKLLFEYDQYLEFIETYSYGPKTLYLKKSQLSIYGQLNDEKVSTKQYIALIFLFADDNWPFPGVFSQIQPEIWTALFEVKNIEDFDRYKLAIHLDNEHRKYFKNDSRICIGGDIFEYNWSGEVKSEKELEECKIKIIGYPLVEINNQDAIKTKILDKLFNK